MSSSVMTGMEIRVLQANIARVFNGAVRIGDLPLELLIYHVYGQLTWVTFLQSLYQKAGYTVSLNVFIQRLLIPVLKSIHQQAENHDLVHVLRTTLISDLDGLALNESMLPQLMEGIRLQVFI